ncbi:hypothetical protein [Neisseria animalis]|uniref:Uncharacterized protein n=1 Tax=Neisseria animalis TaxID=492 RepID=A0A5P3MSM8_NEIAN|nr:hypothetical protein [Neisseria animalis]QEY24617.1 hypothetical protein D0T90_09195 [Neisseria animalis]ROW32971.1 hypothetical protein CGZ60_01530 [Neisseria animalis]VEE07485.1 Uncharacterised protein [Neisseria animalis]
MNKKLSAALAYSAMLAACSDGMPSNEHYTQAINRFAEKQAVCLPLVLNIRHSSDRNVLVPLALGSSEIKIASQSRRGEDINKTALKQLDILADEGFYKRSKEDKPVAKDSDESIPIVIYTLTEEGKQRSRLQKDEPPLFCVGRMEVTHIHSAALSQQTGGPLTARVDYDSRFVGEEWLPELLEIGGLKTLPINLPGTQTAVLVETDDGWKDSREVR